VSLWWSDRIRVGLGSDRVDLVRVGGGWRPRVLASHSRHSVETAVAESQPAWSGVVAALRQGLDDVRTGDKNGMRGKAAACSVVVGNQWVRYQLVPWQAGLASTREYQSYASLLFRSVYGGLAEKWEVACSEARYGYPALACAIDKDLMVGLRSVIAESGLQLASVKPFLSSAIARWQHFFSGSDYWFALMDSGRICLLNTTAGKPRLLCVQPLRGDITIDFPAMLQRESIGLGQANRDLPVYFFGPGLNRESLRELQETRTHVLDAASYLAPVKSDARFAMALA
jgi:hypothetical protein